MTPLFHSYLHTLLLGLLAGQLALPLFVGKVQAASFDEIKKRGYPIAATEDEFRPFEFVRDSARILP
jgi:hypothetical protein